MPLLSLDGFILPEHKIAQQQSRMIDQHDRIAWQKKDRYSLRNQAWLSVQRFKHIFGNAIKARATPTAKNTRVD